MIYLGQPYSHDNPRVMERRFLIGCGVMAALATRGVRVYAPIGHWHTPAQIFAMPTHAAFWQADNLHMLTKADEFHLLVLAGWDRSVGLKWEFEQARRLLKPIKTVKVVSMQMQPNANDGKQWTLPLIHIDEANVDTLIRGFEHGADSQQQGPGPGEAEVIT